jgi:IclR family transcriptional regulator, acetate operon repressor
VIIDVGQKLPLHATASGLAYLSAAPPPVIEAALRKPLARFTDLTCTDPAAVADLITTARRDGYSQSDQLTEIGVHSVAAAILNPRGLPIGAVAIAMPSVRCTPQIMAQCGVLVRDAATEISARLYGTAPLRKVPTHA